MKITRRVMAYGGLVGACLALLWHFSNIIKYGSHYIQEPNGTILALEVILIGSLAILAVTNIILDLRAWLKS